ncbi:MAG: alkylphosphonate utilization protein [Saprospiraceae bacterium]|nr:alkylphosphonate utilization protein [Saprospiraceae bacterium]
MSEIPACPKCKGANAYPSDELWICTECFHEWNPNDEKESEGSDKILDSNGNELQSGDTIIIIKDLPVKGAPKAIKLGTKVKNIRLVESSNGHNIDCKIDGFGAMSIKSEFVRKA